MGVVRYFVFERSQSYFRRNTRECETNGACVRQFLRQFNEQAFDSPLDVFLFFSLADITLEYMQQQQRFTLYPKFFSNVNYVFNFIELSKAKVSLAHEWKPCI